MAPVTKRISERISAYRTPGGTTATQLPSEALKDQQISLRVHPYLLLRLDIIARHARMSRSQLIIELLQDGTDDLLAAMDPNARAEIDSEVNERLRSES